MIKKQKCKNCKLSPCCCSIENENELKNNPSNTNTFNPTINVNPVIQIPPTPMNGVAAIKLDYDQRTTFITDTAEIMEFLEVTIDVGENEAVKLDMFVSASVASATAVSFPILLGVLFGDDINDADVPFAQEFFVISNPADSDITEWGANISLTWIVEPATPGIKTYTFAILVESVNADDLITVFPRGLNAIAFRKA